jgi:hypothetical protein
MRLKYCFRHSSTQGAAVRYMAQHCASPTSFVQNDAWLRMRVARSEIKASEACVKLVEEDRYAQYEQYRDENGAVARCRSGGAGKVEDAHFGFAHFRRWDISFFLYFQSQRATIYVFASV